ncbi:LysR family transcriptional regulator [Ochrobactrum vermis]|uniref:LysR family transcriptional regulator n=1 Tax=Ochrobactrum vermis TaxID=1827297 RepID=A0ABU8PLL2_9HYPH|nr:LysR family transcriptional regulator [Ochrobactrum vermis]PQZ24336.1 LysR family transcriptional regulator [Ochrobactrum vermis]
MAKRPCPIELRHLSYFVAAAEHGSFRKAGAAIGVGASAISRRIRDLEDHVGVSLFHRRTNGVSLTYAGQNFLRRARQGLRTIQEGAQSIGLIGRGEAGVLRVGIFSSLASGFLANLLHAYDERHGDVRVDFVDGNPAEHVAAVRQLRPDVAFITGTAAWQDCETTQLWSEGVFAVLPDKHPLSAKEELGWRDLAEECFIVSEAAGGPEIRDYLVQRLAELGRSPVIEPQKVGRDNLLTLVALGRGLTLTSEATTAARFPGVVYRQMAGESLPFSAVWSRRNDNPAFRQLLSLARAMSRPETRGRVTPVASGNPTRVLLLQNRDLSR